MGDLEAGSTLRYWSIKAFKEAASQARGGPGRPAGTIDSVPWEKSGVTWFLSLALQGDSVCAALRCLDLEDATRRARLPAGWSREAEFNVRILPLPQNQTGPHGPHIQKRFGPVVFSKDAAERGGPDALPPFQPFEAYKTLVDANRPWLSAAGKLSLSSLIKVRARSGNSNNQGQAQGPHPLPLPVSLPTMSIARQPGRLVAHQVTPAAGPSLSIAAPRAAPGLRAPSSQPGQARPLRPQISSAAEPWLGSTPSKAQLAADKAAPPPPPPPPPLHQVGSLYPSGSGSPPPAQPSPGPLLAGPLGPALSGVPIPIQEWLAALIGFSQSQGQAAQAQPAGPSSATAAPTGNGSAAPVQNLRPSFGTTYNSVAPHMPETPAAAGPGPSGFGQGGWDQGLASGSGSASLHGPGPSSSSSAGLRGTGGTGVYVPSSPADRDQITRGGKASGPVVVVPVRAIHGRKPSRTGVKGGGPSGSSYGQANAAKPQSKLHSHGAGGGCAAEAFTEPWGPDAAAAPATPAAPRSASASEAHSKMAREEEEEPECCVCLCPFSSLPGEDECLLPVTNLCGHSTCVGCYRRLLAASARPLCPMGDQIPLQPGLRVSISLVAALKRAKKADHRASIAGAAAAMAELKMAQLAAAGSAGSSSSQQAGSMAQASTGMGPSGLEPAGAAPASGPPPAPAPAGPAIPFPVFTVLPATTDFMPFMEMFSRAFMNGSQAQGQGLGVVDNSSSEGNGIGGASSGVSGVAVSGETGGAGMRDDYAYGGEASGAAALMVAEAISGSEGAETSAAGSEQNEGSGGDGGSGADG